MLKGIFVFCFLLICMFSMLIMEWVWFNQHLDSVNLWERSTKRLKYEMEKHRKQALDATDHLSICQTLIQNQENENRQLKYLINLEKQKVFDLEQQHSL